MNAPVSLATIADDPDRTPLDNPIVRWFEALPEAEKAAYDRLAKLGRLYGGDPEAEARAFEDGTHPLLTSG